MMMIWQHFRLSHGVVNNTFVLNQCSFSMPGLVTARRGDCLRAGKLSPYVTNHCLQPPRSTQPCRRFRKRLASIIAVVMLNTVLEHSVQHNGPSLQRSRTIVLLLGTRPTRRNGGKWAVRPVQLLDRYKTRTFHFFCATRELTRVYDTIRYIICTEKLTGKLPV